MDTDRTAALPAGLLPGRWIPRRAWRWRAGLCSIAVLALALLVAPAPGGTAAAAAAQVAGAQQGADARALLRIASGLLDRTRRTAGRVAPASLRAAFGAAETSLARVSRTLAGRDTAFFRALSEGSRVFAGLRVAADQSGIADPGFRRDVDDLTAVYSVLRSNYGWEALRWSQGHSLRPEERRRLAALQQANRRLAGRLRRVAERTRRAGDAEAAGEAARLARRADGLASARPELAAYLSALQLLDTLTGEWAAHAAAAPARRLRTAWKAAEPAVLEAEEVADATVDEEVGFLFTADLGSAPEGGWLFAQQPVEVPAGSGLDEAFAQTGPEPPAVEEAAAAEILEGEEPGAGLAGAEELGEAVEDAEVPQEPESAAAGAAESVEKPDPGESSQEVALDAAPAEAQGDEGGQEVAGEPDDAVQEPGEPAEAVGGQPPAAMVDGQPAAPPGVPGPATAPVQEPGQGSSSARAPAADAPPPPCRR